MVTLVHAKPRSYYNRLMSIKQRECELRTCSAVANEEWDNCVLQCISQKCYQEVFAEDPLEDGEIDTKRSQTFYSCFRGELVMRGRAGR